MILHILSINTDLANYLLRSKQEAEDAVSKIGADVQHRKKQGQVEVGFYFWYLLRVFRVNLYR
jgi:hypothetical protein